MEEKMNLGKVSVKELELCPYDIEYLEDADIHTIQDILDYIKDGSRLYYIRGIHDNLERDILRCLDSQFDIKNPYKDLDIEEYMRIYQKSAWLSWCSVRDELAASESTVLSKTLHKLGVSTRTANTYGRADLTTLGDLVAYRYAGGDFRRGIRNAGEASENEVLKLLEDNDLLKPYDELSGPMKAYVNRRLYWIKLCNLGLSHKVVLRFHREGFVYIGQVRKYLSKGNTIQDLLWEEGLTEDFGKLCTLVIGKLYKNGVPFSKEVEI